jgi:urease accessory protein UreE
MEDKSFEQVVIDRNERLKRRRELGLEGDDNYGMRL